VKADGGCKQSIDFSATAASSPTYSKVKDIKVKSNECCNHDCNEGRNCPLRKKQTFLEFIKSIIRKVQGK
jgi:hypothetical protein